MEATSRDLVARARRKLRSKLRQAQYWKNSSNSNTDPKSVISLLEQLRPIDNGYELVRVGGPTDGGYVIPMDFDDAKFQLFSPGVGPTAKFELELLERFHIPGYMADPFVEGRPDLPAGLVHEPIFIGVGNSHGFAEQNLQRWISQRLASSSEIVLQMDIEGSEYAALLSLDDEVLKRIRVAVVEFHNLSALLNSFSYHQLIAPALRRVLSEFDVVHTHANNCCPTFAVAGQYRFPEVIEVTFHRKDRRQAHRPNGFRSLPHAADAPSVSTKPECFLPSHWYTT